MSGDSVKVVEELHAEYVRLSGQAVSLMGREIYWWEWIRRGLTVADLRLLIGHIKRERAAGNNVRGADLKFRNLVMNADYAEEDIIALRARMRGAPRDPHRAAVLEATGRPGNGGAAAGTARQAGAVAAEIARDPEAARKAFEEFKRMGEGLRS